MCISTPRSSLVVRFLSVFLLCCTSLYASVDQTGKQKITVVGTDVTLETVFKQIEKQTGLRFMYAVEAVDVKEKVTVMFEKMMLDEVLENLLGKKGIEWVYREGVISLKKEKDDTRIQNRGIPVEPITILGKVVDIKGSPVPGATVRIKGTIKGTRTDGNGNFVLNVQELNVTLQISSIGFQTKEVIANTNSLTIRMSEAVGILDETIIVGYGTTTQRFNTGNVSSVKAEEIAKQPVSDPLLALQGRIPGMIVTQTTGVQGGQVNVQIRGRNSLSNGVIPLFIIDGIPYSPSISAPTLTSYGAIGNTISALSFVNPSDIESIDVLKDADATAIYGSRGANGVILITTKKGKLGAGKVDINICNGWAKVAKRRELMNTSQYLEMRNEAFSNDGIVPSDVKGDPGYAPDLKMWDTTRYTDWQKTLIGETARYTDAQMSVSGGNTSMQYFLGGNYHKETTVYPGDFSSQNGGAHFSITGSSLNQKLRTILTGGYNVKKNNFPGLDFASNISLPPDAPPVYTADGRLNWENSTWDNPFIQLVSRMLDARTNNLISSVDVSYRLLRGLTIKANLGYNELRNSTFTASTIAGMNPRRQNTATATAIYGNSVIKSWIFEPQVAYNYSNKGLEFNSLLGATLLGNVFDQQSVLTAGIKDDALIRNPASASSYFVMGTGTKYKYAAFFGRSGINYLDRYLFNLTIRRDGSSRFGARRQFATFASIGAGWIFSQEEFIHNNVRFLSYGKLRASYGTTGNDQIGDYQYLDRYEFQEQFYQNSKGLNVLGIYNPDFAWELTKKAELGLETGFWKDRILFSTSYYLNRSTNQLIGYPLPSMTGASFIVGNLPAVIQNNGWEFVLTTKNLLNKKLEWTTGFNISANKNKLVSYSGNGAIYAKQGRSLSIVDVNKFLGVDPSSGTYLFADINGKAGPADQAAPVVPINLAPSFFGGMQNTFAYKGFQLSVFFQFVKQKGPLATFEPGWIPGAIRNQSPRVLTRWKKPGDNSSYQKFNQNLQLYGDYGTWLTSDGAYGDASFIRCKNVFLSWQIPNEMKRKLNVNGFKIYLQGQNLFTITKYPGWDPETQSLSSIPPLRIVTMGVQVML